MIAVLPVSAPYTLEGALGYPGDRPYFGLFWTPEMRMEGTGGGWAVRISDGYHEWLGNIAGWLTFVGHPLVAPHLQKLGFGFSDDAPTKILVVDRDTRALVLFEFSAGLAFLAEHNAPGVPAGDTGPEVEVRPDPASNLPLTVIELPDEPVDDQLAEFLSGSSLGGAFDEIPLESFDVEHFRDMLADSLVPVEALREELDRMQERGGGTVTLQ